MPKSNVAIEGDQELQLHSVHFIGDILRNDETYRRDVDVVSELDLLSVVAHKDGTFSYYALGNIKVTKASAVSEATTQNNMAELVINGHIGKTKITLSEKDTCIVKKVVAQIVGTNQPIELTDKLKKAGTPSKLTIGANKAVGAYDKTMSLSTDEISTLSLILREMEKRK